MAVGTTHRKCALVGRVKACGYHTGHGGGVSFFLEDICGNLCNVGVYNIPDADALVAVSMFPVGRTLVIIEPYLKQGRDGRKMIRIDKPNDIQNFALPEMDIDSGQAKHDYSTVIAAALAWKELGNRCSKLDPPTAVACYGRGVALLGPAISSLLANRALVWKKMGEMLFAVRDAAIAVFLDNNNVKACYRLVSAIYGLHGTDVNVDPALLKSIGNMLCSVVLQNFPKSDTKTQKKFRKMLRQNSKSEKSLSSSDSRGDICIAERGLWWEIPCFAATLSTSTSAEMFGDGDWINLKKNGGECFMRNDFSGALAKYSEAINVFDESTSLSILLTNQSNVLSKCACDIANNTLSLCSATAGLVVTAGSNTKGWWFRMLALEKMKLPQQAVCCAKKGLEVATASSDQKKCTHFDKAILRLEGKVLELKRVPDPSKTKTSSAAHKKIRAKNEKATTTIGEHSLEEIKMYHMMEHLRLPKNVTKMAPFHMEFPRHTEWPIGVDPAIALQILEEGFYVIANQPFATVKEYTQPGVDIMTRQIFLKRWGITAIKYSQWIQDSIIARKYGNVLDIEKLATTAKHEEYNGSTSHSFSNNPLTKSIVESGQVHVAVGFVDLGVLLMCRIVDTVHSSSGPFRFVGVERSAYAVAKSLVIWEAAKLSGAKRRGTGAACRDVGSISRAMLQMWFSAAWDPSTESIFRSALANTASVKCSDEVQVILENWKNSPCFPLSHARREWNRNHHPRRTKAGHLKRRRDRLDYMKYFLTGDFGLSEGSNATIVGNSLMFNLPEGTPPLEGDESMWGIIQHNSEFYDSISKSDSTYLSVLESTLLRNMNKLVKWAATSSVVVELWHKDIANCQSDIAALHPYTISWSNLPDYFGFREFHQIARACSLQGDTIHCAYSMNWPMQTFGVHLFDFIDSEQRKDLIEGAFNSIKNQYERLGVGSFFRCPPPENPANAVSAAMAYHLFDKWADCWFQAAKESSNFCKKIYTRPELYQPFARACGTCHFSWTYDPAIDIQESDPCECVNVK